LDAASFCNYTVFLPELMRLLSRAEHVTAMQAACAQLLRTGRMQGREENILTSSDKLVAFKKKVAIWKN